MKFRWRQNLHCFLKPDSHRHLPCVKTTFSSQRIPRTQPPTCQSSTCCIDVVQWVWVCGGHGELQVILTVNASQPCPSGCLLIYLNASSLVILPDLSSCSHTPQQLYLSISQISTTTERPCEKCREGCVFYLEPERWAHKSFLLIPLLY